MLRARSGSWRGRERRERTSNQVLNTGFFAAVAISANGGSAHGSPCSETTPLRDPRRKNRDGDDVIPAAEMIGEGVISAHDDELGGGVESTPDGKTLIFREIRGAALPVQHVRIRDILADGKWGQAREYCHSPGGIAIRIRWRRPMGNRFCLPRIRPVNAKGICIDGRYGARSGRLRMG